MLFIHLVNRWGLSHPLEYISWHLYQFQWTWNALCKCHFAPNITFEYKLGLSEKEKSQLWHHLVALGSFLGSLDTFLFSFIYFIQEILLWNGLKSPWTPSLHLKQSEKHGNGSYPLCTKHSLTTGTTLSLDMGESPIGKGAPHIHFLYSQFSLFLARSLDNTSIVRDEYTQSYTSDHCLAPHHPNLSVFHCPTVPFPLSHPTLLST